VRAVAFDESVGGLAFDAIIAKLITARAEKKKAGCTSSIRARATIQKEAIKGRTVLSANKEYNYALEFDGVSVAGVLSRQEFEESASELFERSLLPFKESLKEPLTLTLTLTLLPFKESLKESGLNLGDIESIELVGGAFRMPKVQSLLMGYLEERKMEKKLRTSMNGEEAAALGATYYAAFLAGYHIRGFNLLDVAPYDIQVKVGSHEEATIFAKHSSIPAILSRSLKAQDAAGDVSLSLHGLNGDMFAWRAVSNGTEAVQRKAYFKLDRSGIARIEAVEDYVAPVEDGAPLKPLALEMSLIEEPSRATFSMLRTYRKDRLKWDEYDIEIRKDQDARNALESFLFETKSKLEGEELMGVTLAEERETVSKSLETLEEWLFDDEGGANARAKAYKAKMNETEQLLRPAYFRLKEIETRPLAVKQAKLAVLDLSAIQKKFSNHTMHGNYTDEAKAEASKDADEMKKEVEAFSEWLEAQRIP